MIYLAAFWSSATLITYNIAKYKSNPYLLTYLSLDWLKKSGRNPKQKQEKKLFASFGKKCKVLISKAAYHCFQPSAFIINSTRAFLSGQDPYTKRNSHSV